VKDWVRRFLDDGDEGAAAKIVAHLYPTVSKVLHHRLPPQLSVEDVAQQVFLKVFSKLHQFQGRRPLEHWVSKIAYRTCLNAMRGARMQVELRRGDLSEEEDAMLDEIHADDAAPDIGTVVAARDLVQNLLRCLSPKERLAVELTDLQGYSSHEAARLLGSNAVAVRVRVARARVKMRRHLDRLQGEQVAEVVR
jgi:RNA polymerase sigma-70 factor (ECF subfamily)